MIPGSADGQYEFGSFMSATLSCDHRVIDGAIGAEFRKRSRATSRTQPQCCCEV